MHFYDTFNERPMWKRVTIEKRGKENRVKKGRKRRVKNAKQCRVGL